MVRDLNSPFGGCKRGCFFDVVLKKKTGKHSGKLLEEGVDLLTNDRSWTRRRTTFAGILQRAKERDNGFLKLFTNKNGCFSLSEPKFASSSEKITKKEI
jgi:hypothetical protein